MKPRIQCVQTPWIPDFIASDARANRNYQTQAMQYRLMSRILGLFVQGRWLLRVITLMSVFTPLMRGVKTLNKWSCDGSDPWCAHPSAVPPHVQVRAQAGQA